MTRVNTPIAIGSRFGSLVVVGHVPRPLASNGKRSTNRRVVCKCDCGKFSTPLDSNLSSGRTRSCGHGERIHRELSLRLDLTAMPPAERREALAAGDSL